MKNDDDNLAFFSQITASTTHEITNAISIINELNGLIADQLRSSLTSNTFNFDKLTTVNNKLYDQIKRIQLIVKNLNYFSHIFEKSYGVHDIIILLKNIIELSQRFATLNNLTITADFKSDSIEIFTLPFQFTKMVFNTLKYIFSIAEKDTKVYLSTNEDEHFVNIDIQFYLTKTYINSSNDYKNDLKILAESIKLNYQTIIDNNMKIIRYIYNKQV